MKSKDKCLILAFETSYDETSISLSNKRKILSNVTISQILEQKEYGGAVPDLAAKLHLRNIQKVLKKVFLETKINKEEIDYVAYTEKPGLIICLQIGKIMAETISLYLNKPLISCNHLEGHVYASLINKKDNWQFPVLSLIISGGHTQIHHLDKHLNFTILGESLDDPVGNCLDKVAILMGYSYPGGPIIEKLALSGSRNYPLSLPKNDDSLDFSFSGLKSQIARLLAREEVNKNDLSYSLQYTIAKILTKKLKIAKEKIEARTIVIGGGVISNEFLRRYLVESIKEWDNKIKVFIPDKEYCTDNAAMIGTLAYYKIINTK